MKVPTSWIRSALVMAAVCLLPTALSGCGGGSTGPTDTRPANAVQGYMPPIAPSGKATWADMVARHEALGAPATVTPPEGGAGEQTPPGGPHGVAGTTTDSTKMADPGASTELVVDLPGFRALGQDISGGIPPDTMGAVGPNHVVTMLNTGVVIHDKLGNQVTAPISLGAFFAPLVGAGMFDPRVQYDSIHDRWLASANRDSNAATSGVGFAISDTDDPTGAWTFYSFDLDPTNTNWADFVSMGFNSTWIALTTDAIQIGGGFVGEHMWVIDKSSALSGGLLTVTQFLPGFANAAGFTARRMKPCVTFDAAEPTLYIASSVYNVAGVERLRISQITGTGGAPSWSVVGGSTVAPGSGLFTPVNAYQTAGFGLFPGAPQSGGATLVDTGRALLGSETVFRNGHIWLTHTGGLPAAGAVTRTAIFWYQIDPTAMPAPIVQSGVCDGGGGGVVPGPNETITQGSEDSTITGGGKPGQSFTVSVTGTITDVRWNPTGGYPAGTVDVYAGAGNGGALLASEAIGAGGAGFQTFTFTTPVAVTPGVYTFYVPAPNVGLSGIRAQSGNVYTGGIMYAGAGTVANTDMRFEVVIAGALIPVPGVFYYYPSLAVNARDDMCLGFSRSSSSLFVEAVVTGRDFDDPPNTLDPLVVQKVGEGFYSQIDNNGRNRWGDYSATCVDPSDDMTIWSLQQYAQAGNTYGTWWARHAAFAPLTATSSLTYPITAAGATTSTALNCDDPPTPPSVFAECTGTSGSACTASFNATAPSGSAFQVRLVVDGVTLQTQTALGQVPGPSNLVGSFNFNLPMGGPYLVEVITDGGGGDIDVCQINLTVRDTTPPTIGPCPVVAPVECTGPSGAVVTFTAPTASDVCDSSVTVTCASIAPAVGLTSGSTFPVGDTTVRCTATDDAGNTDTCDLVVRVQDTVPPVVTANARRSMLFLPRNGMIDVLLEQTATDLCTGIASKTVTVYSSQPNVSAADTGATYTPDASLAGAALSLRAETLLGTGDPAGRAYLIVVTATDNGFPAPNTASACTWVVIPKTATVADIVGARAIALTAAASCPDPGPGPAPGATPNTILAPTAIP